MVQSSEHASKSFLLSWRYALFWVSSLFSNIGTWMQQVAEPWVVLNLSNSPFLVGLDSFALTSPGLIFGLFGGVLADRYDLRKTILFFQSIQFLCIVVLLTLLILGWLKVWMIVLISFLVGLTDSLSMPSFQSIIPSLVNQKDIKRAVPLNSIQFNLSRVLGPAIAGVVIARFGAVACFGANATSYIPFFLSLYFIYPRKRPRGIKEPTKANPTKQLNEFRQLLRNPEIGLPLFTAFVTNIFCGPLITFCVVLIKNFFQADVGNFGGAITAFGIGGLMGAAVLFLNLPKSFKRNRIAATMAIFLGATIIIIALNHSYIVLLILLVLAGAALTTCNISINTFLQENVTNNIRGKTASLYQLALSGGNSIGALFTGFTVSQLNISNALIINGSFAVVLQSWLLLKQLKTVQAK